MLGRPQCYLFLVWVAMRAGEVALLENFRLGIQPVLDMTPMRAALVHIAEVSPGGHFVFIRGKVSFVMI